jgi:hypothetical protein
MMKQNKVILASVLAVSLMAISVLVTPQIFAAEKESSQYNKANEVAIHVVFSFREAVESSDSFQAFTQVTGFDRSAESPTFNLVGEMDFDRAYLYEAADTTSDKGVDNTQHEYGQFDVEVFLHKDKTSIRQFSYADCRLTDYTVETLFDKEEGWNTTHGFATVDNFEFACSGLKASNPQYEILHDESYNGISQSSMDLKDTSSWPNSFQ